MQARHQASLCTTRSKIWDSFTLDKVKNKVSFNLCKVELVFHVTRKHLKRRHIGHLDEADSELDSPR